MFTDYCATEVARNDYGRYIITLMMPVRTRPALFALFAFHNEISRIPLIVSEPTLGLIRLQWWHEAIERLYQGKPDAHEVIRGLEKSLQDGVPWSEQDFHALIDGYEPLIRDEEFHPDLLNKLLLKMAVVATGENKRAKLTKLNDWLRKYRTKRAESNATQPDGLLASKLLLAAYGILK